MEIAENVSLKPFTTFRVNVTAKRMVVCSSLEELAGAVRLIRKEHDKSLVLGGGSNVLFTHDYDGTIILNRIKGIEIIKENDGYVFIKAGSGELWHDLVCWCVERNYGGIENMSLIPGCVGAGPIQNIGAYGVELKDVLHETEVMMLDTCEQKVFSNTECRFSYRDSIFRNELKDKCIITSVTLKLSKNPVINASYGSIQQELRKDGITDPTIRDISRVVIRIRQSKLPDPEVLGNAGSFFKNPEIEKSHFEKLKITYPAIPGFEQSSGKVKVPAGWLIEQCGFKGKRHGNTGAHKDQALVIVNYGHATGAEIAGFAKLVMHTVEQQFDIRLEPEVNII